VEVGSTRYCGGISSGLPMSREVGDSLPPHKFWWKHPPFLRPLSIRDLLIHFSSLLHDQIQHILGIIHLRIGFRHELVQRIAEELDVSSCVSKDIV